MYQVRFHLGRGPNYLRWQVRGPEGVRYYDPDSFSLLLRECVLKNRRSVAEKVKRSQRRDVCGHVACLSVEVRASRPPEGRMVHFDPKVAPYWTVEGSDGPQDHRRMDVLFSSGRRLYQPRPYIHEEDAGQTPASGEAAV